MSKILYINNNNFHHLGRSQMCAGGCYVFRTSKPHSGTLWLQYYKLLLLGTSEFPVGKDFDHIDIYSI